MNNNTERLARKWAERINCPVCWGDVQWERDELFGDTND